MAKTRVSELAKEFGITSKEMLSHLKDMKIPAKSASSALEDAYVSMVRKKLAPQLKAREEELRAAQEAEEAARRAEEEARRAAEEAARACGFQTIHWVKTGGVITTHGGKGAFGIVGFAAKE